MNINQVVLGGNIVRDPEIRYTASGVPIGSFTIANNRKWQGKDGSAKEEASFIGCTAFGTTAETIGRYFRKGNRILVQGRITQESWDDKKTGARKEKTKVVVERFEFVDRASDRQSPQISQDSRPPAQTQPAPVEDDDVPF